MSNWTLHRSRGHLGMHAGPWQVDTTGRGVFLCWVTVAVLAVAGVAVIAAGRRELRRRWLTWAVIAPVVGLPIWLGPGPTALLAALVGLQAVREYGQLTGLPKRDIAVLMGLGIAFPLCAYAAPHYLALTPLVALGTAAVPLLSGDTAAGLRRASFTAFAAIWLCWSVAHLVLLWKDAYLLCFAVAGADVAAWCGGRALRGFRWGRRPLSLLSPNKTVGGLAGAVLGAVIILAVLGHCTVGWVIAVGLGGVAGDLLESMVKRQAGVKDAGAWLPGFGGLLDRIDSLLIVLPLAAVLA